MEELRRYRSIKLSFFHNFFLQYFTELTEPCLGKSHINPQATGKGRKEQMSSLLFLLINLVRGRRKKKIFFKLISCTTRLNTLGAASSASDFFSKVYDLTACYMPHGKPAFFVFLYSAVLSLSFKNSFCPEGA